MAKCTRQQSRPDGTAMKKDRSQVREMGRSENAPSGRSRSGALAFEGRTGELCGVGRGEALESGQLGSVHSALLRARGRNAVSLLAGGWVRVARKGAPWLGHVLRVHGYAAEAGQAVCDLSLPPQVERRHQFSEAICAQGHRSIPPGFVTGHPTGHPVAQVALDWVRLSVAPGPITSRL